MQSSTAQRERLVSPLSLALMAGLFGLAFFVLKPDTVPGLDVFGKADGVAGNGTDIDELTLAYLRAQSESGRVSESEMLSVVARLVKVGRLQEAQELLAQNPKIDVGEVLRFEIDLASAAADSPVSLSTALNKLIESPYLHQTTLLNRGVLLSKTLQQPRLSASLYALWAAQTELSATGVSRYMECSRYLNGLGERTLALACLQQAKKIAQKGGDTVRVNLAMLPLIDAGSAQQNKLTDELLDLDDLSTTQIENAAQVLLQNGRPDVSYRLYARLAIKEPDKVAEWLPLAARWAQAAGKPADAAVFLDALANETGLGKPAPEERQRLQKEVESLLLAAGRTKDVYARTQARLRKLPQDEAALREGVIIARQLGEYSQALYWNTQVLSFSPKDMEAMRLQRELAQAASKLPLALSWAEKVVQQQTASLDDREKLARISEWSGKPDEALEHWQWLAQPASKKTLDNRIRALREVVRLAELTLRPAQAAKALREITLYEEPGNDDIVRLVSLYELDGRPEAASVALQDIIALYGPQPFVLRTLASNEFHHSRYEQSLASWELFADSFGSNTESTLARMELLWQLDRKDEAANVAELLKGRSQLSGANDYQLRLMAEIGWQYRKPWLTMLVKPRLNALNEVGQRSYYGRRSVELLQEQGEDKEALIEAMQLWGSTGNDDFAFMAMQLAVKLDDRSAQARFSPEQEGTKSLQESAFYWAQVGADRLREGDQQGATEAYERALRLDEAHVESISGLIWMAIGDQDDSRTHFLLNKYQGMAAETPALWQAMALGYLQMGAAASSLPWFDRMLDQISADYGMLLTYADALEYAGRSASAFKVRQYTLQQLRPLLVEGSVNEQALLLRQYSRLSVRYAGVESNEQLFNHLLKTDAQESPSGQDDLWRQDMAISWLMSTQQFEHARLIMAQIHHRRLQAPAWQQVALALKDDDEAALSSLVQAKGPLSVGNHILALRQLGNDRDAYALVQKVMSPGAPLAGSNLDDLQLAQEQYVSLRDARPGFVAAFAGLRNSGKLNIRETGVRIRHTFSDSNLGMSLDLTKRQLDSDRYDIEERDELSDVALSLFFGTARQGGRLTTGYLDAEDGDLFYGSASYARRLANKRSRISTELAYNEEVSLSPELLIGARQHRFTIGYDADIGHLEFIRVQADATEINTRVEQNKVARGLGGSVELGVRGSFGSNAWSTSVRAAHAERDREQRLPAELRFSRGSTMDDVLAAQAQSVSIGASLSRGGINADFPQVSSPRYYLSANLGHNWPDRVIGFQMGAGAGIRVLGGDELSFSVSHDTQPTVTNSGDATAVGISYRYHFQ
ncbi:tetratricopeptide repeat protein [Granulosicoccus antarcticus]|uniref:PelB C-terminal domain-containing protein n=1 Tax=Granulosicoccus antarcticus IMCC3135 TaxID=1192854 RepID=A0A2Z2NGZ7_9GAMM|nr:tetratricopeptide repeat protein [Granulosicoccus antarcticus]ASJ70566.1 hypothetical protein IMCC3135_02260 [Granulosicoccus antarcticus IMCC3135]